MTRRGRSAETAFALVGQVANLSYGAVVPRERTEQADGGTSGGATVSHEPTARAVTNLPSRQRMAI